MYWYNIKLKKIALGIFLLAVGMLTACRPEVKNTQNNFFDIKGYFTAEAEKLTKLSPVVIKSAGHNGTSQTKKLNINNWKNELALFIGSDINKPAWRDGYIVTQADSLLTYKAKQPDLKTRWITIKKHGDKVIEIRIFNHTQNMLYTNSEMLTYVPDAEYLIKKQQQVRFLGTNHYKIKGIIR